MREQKVLEDRRPREFRIQQDTVEKVLQPFTPRLQELWLESDYTPPRVSQLSGATRGYRTYTRRSWAAEAAGRSSHAGTHP